MRAFITLLSLSALLSAFTLDELVDIAHKNRLVESATHALNSSKKSFESTKSSYLPNFNIGANLQNAYEETPSMPENSAKAFASLKYIIYDGGKRDDLYNKLSSNIDANRKNLDAVKNDIALDVARLYFEYFSLISDKDATLQEMEQLKAEYSRLEMFYKTGSVTQDEVQKIDSTLKSAVVKLYETDLSIQKVLHTLEYYTAKQISTLSDGSSVNYEDTNSNDIRPDIKSLEYQTLSTLYEAQSKKSAALPNLYFENTASYTEYYFENEPASNLLVNKQNIATLNIAWNIFDFGSTREDYESKYEEYLSKKAALEHTKAIADVDYRLAKKSLEIGKIKIDATKATLDAASSTYELVKLRYQNGMVDNVTYLQALSDKYEAARGYKRALYDYEVKKAEIIYYSGKNIKEYLQ